MTSVVLCKFLSRRVKNEKVDEKLNAPVPITEPRFKSLQLADT